MQNQDSEVVDADLDDAAMMLDDEITRMEHMREKLRRKRGMTAPKDWRDVEKLRELRELRHELNDEYWFDHDQASEVDQIVH